MTVDDQLEALETRLTTQLQYALFVNINLNYWEEVDELDELSIQVIRDIVHDVFEPVLNVYTGTPVVPIIQCSRLLIEHSLTASMNVPFPRDPVLHVHRVVNNMLTIFIQTTYAQLRTEMIMVNHNAHVLQRAWREAVSNPSRSPCKRRLLREFNEASAYSYAALSNQCTGIC
jgi:hypothetical protein